jgi:hypothetical protein
MKNPSFFLCFRLIILLGQFSVILKKEKKRQQHIISKDF